MEYKFPKELRGKLIDYFKRNNDLEITDEMADEWLDSLADLFQAFINIENRLNKKYAIR